MLLACLCKIKAKLLVLFAEAERIAVTAQSGHENPKNLISSHRRTTEHLTLLHQDLEFFAFKMNQLGQELRQNNYPLRYIISVRPLNRLENEVDFCLRIVNK